jgi:hypothetical protein
VTRTESGAVCHRATAEDEIVSIETMFEQLVGRQPTQAEGERLHRIRSVLGLRDNDAFWAIVLALEVYDSFFRAYPAQLATVTEHAVENVRAACAAAAAQEVAAVQRALAEKVADTSVTIAQKLADRPVGVHRVTALLAAVVAFGSLCVHAGYELAAPGKPFWMHSSEDGSPASRALTILLSAPAGWMMFALLVPAAVQGARFGWRMAVDAFGDRRDQAIGWCIVVCCVLGAAACALLLARLA